MARPAVEGAMAANLQGRFWEFHDTIFSYISAPRGKNLDDNELNQIPITMGLDMARYLKDVKGPLIKGIIDRDLREGQLAGVTATPTLYVNGYRVENRSPQGIQQMIDKELRKLKGKSAR